MITPTLQLLADVLTNLGRVDEAQQLRKRSQALSWQEAKSISTNQALRTPNRLGLNHDTASFSNCNCLLPAKTSI